MQLQPSTQSWRVICRARRQRAHLLQRKLERLLDQAAHLQPVIGEAGGGERLIGGVAGVGGAVRLEDPGDVRLRIFRRELLRLQQQPLHECRGVLSRLQGRLPGTRSGDPPAAREKSGAGEAEAGQEEASVDLSHASSPAAIHPVIMPRNWLNGPDSSTIAR